MAGQRLPKSDRLGTQLSRIELNDEVQYKISNARHHLALEKERQRALEEASKPRRERGELCDGDGRCFRSGLQLWMSSEIGIIFCKGG